MSRYLVAYLVPWALWLLYVLATQFAAFGLKWDPQLLIIAALSLVQIVLVLLVIYTPVFWMIDRKLTRHRTPLTLTISLLLGIGLSTLWITSLKGMALSIGRHWDFYALNTLCSVTFGLLWLRGSTRASPSETA